MQNSHKRDALSHEQRRARRPNSQLKFRRSKHKVLAGIASGITNYTAVDTSLIRILLVIAALMSFGIVVFVYLALWLLIPLEE